ncbi:sugar ABC transporter substrate-binding protein [Actinoplanes sp. LDG1-06]|uniref:Sugar ABC transporter substrate-binding protein n=1 Tax=Paractinoplanes ovalisporus TaxID=2810368 RepID=A0ABS2A585_9ACTN|nr:sugar ABC transporter substrate-binding protein [Actinoplanes ovalisporus]MBM2614885.1 sugar ABC transporter substrate-binding protein [Actinoplanes ovalisporus]
MTVDRNRHRSRARLAVTAAALLGATLMSACSPPGAGTGSGSAGKADDGGPITLNLWSNLTVAAQSDTVKQQAEKCATQQDGVSVQFEAVPFDSMYPKMVTAFKAGNGPDVMNTLEGGVAAGQAGNYIVPVDDVIDAHGRADFIPSYLHAVSKDDQTWAVPDWALHQEVWYRKDLFAAKGIQIPKSWPELLEAAKKLNDPAAGVKGFAVPMGSALVAPQTYYQFLYANGVHTFDPETGEYALDRDKAKAVEATQYMLDLYKAASPPEARTWVWNDFRTGFVQGKLGMVMDFGAVVGLAKEQNPDMLKNMGVFPLPAPTTGAKPQGVLGGGYFYMIGKSNERREKAAKTLVECMMAPESAAARANTRPVFALPATNSAADTATYKDNATVKEFGTEITTIREQILPQWYRYGMEAGLNQLAGQIEATTFVGDQLQAAAAGSKTAEQAFDAINAEMKRLAKVS